jgi:hypothetical protein
MSYPAQNPTARPAANAAPNDVVSAITGRATGRQPATRAQTHACDSLWQYRHDASHGGPRLRTEQTYASHGGWQGGGLAKACTQPGSTAAASGLLVQCITLKWPPIAARIDLKEYDSLII